MYLLTALALIPLGLVLWFTLAKGLPPALHIEFYTNVFRPVGVPGAGVKHAIVGTLMLVGMASLMAIPIGILGGIYLAEYGHARWAGWVRLSSDVLVGTPSIAVGLFIYALLVAPLHRFSAQRAARIGPGPRASAVARLAPADPSGGSAGRDHRCSPRCGTRLG
jgi:phosphate transport system permease protein